MPDTFGGEHHRPRNPQRSNSRRQLQDWASYDNQPATGPGCLLIATICVTAATALLRKVRS